MTLQEFKNNIDKTTDFIDEQFSAFSDVMSSNGFHVSGTEDGISGEYKSATISIEKNKTANEIYIEILNNNNKLKCSLKAKVLDYNFFQDISEETSDVIFFDSKDNGYETLESFFEEHLYKLL